MSRWWLGAVLWAASADATAFCGTYLGPVGATLTNESSHVIAGVAGDRITLTLANDYSGDATDFAMVVPVPATFADRDVDLVDPEVVDQVLEYGMPRLVEMTCDELYPYRRGGKRYPYADRRYRGMSSGDDAGCYGADSYLANSSGLGPMADGAVEVSSTYLLGAYEIFVLDATGADGLAAWLDAQGFDLPPRSETVLADYIASGSRFVAARVHLDRSATEPVVLEPLQIFYVADTLVLPIRLGALNSAGQQDMVVTTLASEAARIRTMPRVELPTDCLYEGRGKDLDRFYEDLIDEAFADEPAAWTLEHQWMSEKCDPCTTGPLGWDVMEALGSMAWYGTTLTRMRVRYAAGAVQDDLQIEFVPNEGNRQQRYVVYLPELEGEFPICGDAEPSAENTCNVGESSPGGAPCDQGAAPAGLLGLLIPGALVWWRRRRE